MESLLDEIKSRGYWKVIIRPAEFRQDYIRNYLSLERIIEKCSVQLRGWAFPHLDKSIGFKKLHDCIEQEVEWEFIREFWRLYQSGQFVHFCGIFFDWEDQSQLRPKNSAWKQGEYLPVEDTLFRFTEIFEFASRYSLTEAGAEQMNIEIVLSGLQDRCLQLGYPRIGFVITKRKSNISEFSQNYPLARTELIAKSKEFALEASKELFARFGWDVTIEYLRGIQTEMGR